MKKWIGLLLAVCLLVMCVSAQAQQVEILGPRGPELPSSFEVAEEEGLSHAQSNEERSEATMGTDVYLFVDPDSASYVTFYVYNDDGEPVPNATILIEYNGVRSVYGITDQNGVCSVYLFRDIMYRYTIFADAHTTQEGDLYPTNATTRANVMLLKYHTLTVYVTNNGKPVLGTVVRVNGEKYLTNEKGEIIAFELVKGNYDVWISIPGGGAIYRKARVRGDTILYVDIANAGKQPSEQEMGFGFLVYDKLYQPEDYVLTELEHKPLDMLRKPGEKDDAYELRRQRYLDEHPNVILVQAQPDREQLAEGDRDLTRKDHTLLYSQRSLMPFGGLLQEWEEQGYVRLAFENEHLGMTLDLAELHSPAMSKAFAVAHAASKGNLAAITQPEYELTLNGMRLDAETIDWNAVRPFEFTFDHVAEMPDGADRSNHELLQDALYQNTVFEFRITPVLPEEVLRVVKEAMEMDERKDETVIDLPNVLFEEEEMRVQMADGKLTAPEDEVLYEWLVKHQPEKMYRVSCWIHCEGVEMDVTSLLNSLKAYWLADEAVQQELHHLPREEGQTELDRLNAACANMEQATNLFALHHKRLQVSKQPVRVVRTSPAQQEEWYSTFARKLYYCYIADVRKEDGQYQLLSEQPVSYRPSRSIAVGPVHGSSLMWLGDAQ